MVKYFKDMFTGLYTIFVGMGITFKYLFKKPVTLQYPEERPAVEKLGYTHSLEVEKEQKLGGYRGFHYFEKDKCIGCLLCVRACPVDCIVMDIKREGKKVEILKYEVDYTKCMFCDLCVDPCPVDCIHMTGENIDFSTWDKNDLIVDFAKIPSGKIPSVKGTYKQRFILQQK